MEFADDRLAEELRFLARRYPKETWDGHANLGELARFWLARHEMFRQFDAVIRDGTQAAIEAKAEAADFRPWLARHLQAFLSQLEGHHQVEDMNYFPVFREAEPRLVAGFDLLESDHDALHEAIEGIVGHANGLLRAPEGDQAAFRSALSRFHDANLELGRGLIRHLDDEEELVIPLILDRGEDFLGGR